MAKTVKDMLEAANASVPRITPAEARELVSREGALIVDVRDAPELERTGKIAGAHHVSRGMLEFRADGSTPYHDPEFRKERPLILYCASGGRSALAGKVLQEMGYRKVYNLGAFKDWVEAGGEVEEPVDQGMEPRAGR
jgi:rhodanese-related sulfurtransferase